MATFEIALPDGRAFQIDAADEATAKEALRRKLTPAAEAPKEEAPKVSQGRTAALMAGQGLTSNFLDEIAGGLNASYDYATGQAPKGFAEAYERRLANARKYLDEAEKSNPATALAAQIGGGLAGGLAMPAANIGRLGAVGNAALTGAGYSALGGVGAGEDLESRAVGGALGAGAGGLLGAAAGRFLPGARPAAPNPQMPVLEAAERQNLPIPWAATSDSRGTQMALQGARNTPFGGNIVEGARDRFTGAMGERLGQAADDVAGGAVSDNRALVGGNIRRSLDEAVVRNRQAQEAPFEALRRAIDPDQPVPIHQNVARNLERVMAERTAAGQGELPRELAPVIELATNPAGATFNGLQRARTTLSEHIDFEEGRGFGTGDLRSLRTSLTNAMERTVQDSARNNPNQALGLFRNANAEFGRLAERNADLGAILRTQSDEALADRVIAMANERSGANIQRLGQLRDEMGEPTFRELAGHALQRMGVSPPGQRAGPGGFSVTTMVTNWDKLSASGRDALFGADGTVRASLNDMMTVGRRWREVEQRFGNASGTARNAGYAAGGAAFMVDPFTTLASVAGGAGLAAVLSRPATATSAARWARAYERAVRQPTEATRGSLRLASRNLSNTLTAQTGIVASVDDFLGPFAGQVAGRADEEKGPQVPPVR